MGRDANEALGFELNQNEFVLKPLSLLSTFLRNYAHSDLSVFIITSTDVHLRWPYAPRIDIIRHFTASI